jgi:hypothetical protein
MPNHTAAAIFGSCRLRALVILQKKGARLRWQSQPRVLGREPGCVDVEQGKNYGQALAGIEINLACL